MSKNAKKMREINKGQKYRWQMEVEMARWQPSVYLLRGEMAGWQYFVYLSRGGDGVVAGPCIPVERGR